MVLACPYLSSKQRYSCPSASKRKGTWRSRLPAHMLVGDPPVGMVNFWERPRSMYWFVTWYMCNWSKLGIFHGCQVLSLTKKQEDHLTRVQILKKKNRSFQMFSGCPTHFLHLFGEARWRLPSNRGRSLTDGWTNLSQRGVFLICCAFFIFFQNLLGNWFSQFRLILGEKISFGGIPNSSSLMPCLTTWAHSCSAVVLPMRTMLSPKGVQKQSHGCSCQGCKATNHS